MTRRTPLHRTVLKSLAAGLAAGVVLALSIGGGIASAQSIAGFDSNSPVDYAADSITLLDRENRVILAGNVQISQGDLNISAGRTTVAFTDAGTLRIQRIDATGGVTVTRGNEAASGTAAIYDFNRRLIILSGNVRLRRGADTLSGGRLVIDLNSGVSSVDGQSSEGGSGRVTGTFQVPDNRR